MMSKEDRQRLERVPERLRELAQTDAIVANAIAAYRCGAVEYVPMLEALVGCLSLERRCVINECVKLAQKSPPPVFIVQGEKP